MTRTRGTRRTWGTFPRLLLVVPLLAAGLALGGPRPASAARVCADEFITGTVRDSIVVAAGTRCDIDDAIIRGSVTVQTGGKLYAGNTEVRGTVTAAGAVVVSFTGGVIREKVTVTGMSAGFPDFQLLNVDVRGDVVVAGNSNLYIQIYANQVRGNLIVRDNLSSAFFWVATNTIGKNLDCSGNNPPPSLLGFPANTAVGAKLGDCAAL